MYSQIKKLADEAVALQNKDRMEAALREIASIACQESGKTMFEDARIAKNGSEPCPECLKPRSKPAPEAGQDLCEIALRHLESEIEDGIARESADRLKAMTGVDLTAQHARETAAAKMAKKVGK